MRGEPINSAVNDAPGANFRSSLRKKFLLLGWIIGILFPFGWLTLYSDTYRRVFDTIFGPFWVHLVMHTLLYLVLAYLLAQLLVATRSPKVSLRRLVLVLSLVLVIALLQESFQLLYLGRWPGADEFLDLGVDLTGGLLGILLSGR